MVTPKSSRLTSNSMWCLASFSLDNKHTVSTCVIIYVCMYIYGLILYTPLEKILIMGVKNLSKFIFLIFTVFATLPLVHTDVFAPQVCAKDRNCLRLHERFMQCVGILLPINIYPPQHQLTTFLIESSIESITVLHSNVSAKKFFFLNLFQSASSFASLSINSSSRLTLSSE